MVGQDIPHSKSYINTLESLFPPLSLSVCLATAFYQRAPYQPDAPRLPLRRGDQIQDVLTKRAVRPMHTYTQVTPSPGAKPVAITSQFQVITSYVPLYTLCGLPNGTASSAAPTFVPPNMPVFNSSMLESMSSSMGIHKRALSLSNSTSAPAFPTPVAMSQPAVVGQPPAPSLANTTSPPSQTALGRLSPFQTPPVVSSTGSSPPYPMLNNTVRPAPTGFRNGTSLNATSSPPDCTTIYSPTQTAICHTTLKGLAAHHTVTDCDQLITYTTQHGYTLAVPSGVTDPATLPADKQPYIVTQTTYSEAPWTDFTASTGVPSSATEKICSSSAPGADQTCVDIRKGLQTSIQTSVTRTTSHVDLTTTLPGPSRVIVETFQADITEVQTIFVLNTRIVSEVSTEGVATVATATETLGTRTVSASPTDDGASTVTIQNTVGETMTSTLY
ncbi:MAG: hypothetical protein Q9162_006185 [Coniocarpon cinnabarinum]